MSRKLRLPCVTETILIDGVYCEEQRVSVDRRVKQIKWRFYERRTGLADSRRNPSKPVREVV
ncbi:Uncharacterised protein [Vibrio fluvialis]|uniref:Transposase n=1 Tax=Vibrio fluvialis TaxID=676 RepID=A0AAX2LPR1_VIBFL|nr:Uncharacterised protein [Vibrio fluvialis]